MYNYDSKSKKTSDLAKIALALPVILLLLVMVFILSGCATGQTAPDPQASAAAPVATEEEPEVVEVSGINAFGDVVTWDNQISLSVSTPTAYSPTEIAAGVVAGQEALIFEFVLTNNSTEPYEPFVYTTASSGGVEASAIFDYEGPMGDVGYPPMTTILPGQSIKWLEAYSVADVSNITLQSSIGFEFDDAIFTNIP